MSSQTQLLPSPIVVDVYGGLTRPHKSLPAWLFYDDAGSALFEEITQLPEYYLTRTERTIFEEHAGQMVAAAGRDLTLVELGAGTATKTSTIISAILRRQRELTFYPIDVSPAALVAGFQHLTRTHKGLTVKPLVADYTAGIDQLRGVAGRKLVLYIGSSIGNFEPLEASRMLVRIRRSLGPGDALLIGTDMAKDPTVLRRAYDDEEGVTAKFNLNVLARINRELGGHFELSSFRHVAVWNEQFSRIEMHIESLREQSVAIDTLQINVPFEKGERIHTENSYKFTLRMVRSILQNGGFTLERTWMDERKWFALHLARVEKA